MLREVPVDCFAELGFFLLEAPQIALEEPDYSRWFGILNARARAAASRATSGCCKR